MHTLGTVSAALILLLGTCVFAADQLSIIPEKEQPARVLVVVRLPVETWKSIAVQDARVAVADGEQHLVLQLVGADGRLGLPVLGRYMRRNEDLEFTPRYGLSHGETYRATSHGTKEKLTRDYQVPAPPPLTPPTVTAIYPSGDAVPSNALKFYLHFSQPMREGGEIFDLIELWDDQGRSVEDPWRRTELWSADATRLTLWIHPGRVKKGVKLRDVAGPVLEPGRQYSLTIGSSLRGANGQPLGKPFVKKFKATTPDERRPLPADWKLTVPPAGSREPLRVDFHEALDHAQLFRFLEIRAGGKQIAGEISVESNEHRWAFRPKEPWGALEYTLHVDERLEDLAGNTPDRVFDLDLNDPPVAAVQRTRTFRPGEAMP